MASNATKRFSPTTLFAVASGVAGGLFAAQRWRRHFRLRGKNALVTGGTRGLGLEIARVLVKKGANVALTARDDGELARALLDLNDSAKGVRIVGEPCDLRDGDSIDAMLAAVRRKLGPIDVLVNNAGIIQVGPVPSMRMDDFEQAMQLHCFAPLRTMLGVREEMRARGGGRIANISSIGGVVAVPHLLPYSASKFALVGLSQGMRAELARDRIFVSTVTPGLMRTGSPRHALFKGDHEHEYAWFATSDALPLLSVSARRAARRVVRAIERGEAHVAIGLPAKLATIASGIAPGLVTDVASAANMVLPNDTDERARPGSESAGATSDFVEAVHERAAARNNEL